MIPTLVRLSKQAFLGVLIGTSPIFYDSKFGKDNKENEGNGMNSMVDVDSHF